MSPNRGSFKFTQNISSNYSGSGPVFGIDVDVVVAGAGVAGVEVTAEL